jgi:hypothetical protein
MSPALARGRLLASNSTNESNLAKCDTTSAKNPSAACTSGLSFPPACWPLGFDCFLNLRVGQHRVPVLFSFLAAGNEPRGIRMCCPNRLPPQVPSNPRPADRVWLTALNRCLETAIPVPAICPVQCDKCEARRRDCCRPSRGQCEQGGSNERSGGERK